MGLKMLSLRGGAKRRRSNLTGEIASRDKKRRARNDGGVTLVEVVIVIAVAAILGTAFASVMVPMMNFYFYYPQSSRVNNAGADVLQIILEGDEKARGLRFASIPCTLPAGGSSRISVATATTLTYHHAMTDACGNGGTNSNSVALAYNAGSQTVTRSINGAAAAVIPYYATAASGIQINPPSGINFFRYFDAAGTDLGAAPAVGSIRRVDVTLIASSGTGLVKHSAGQIKLKAGADIHQIT